MNTNAARLLGECITRNGDRLVWRKRPVEHFNFVESAQYWNATYAGRPVALRPDSQGYAYIRFKAGGRSYTWKAHRALWLLAHGTLPKQLDHINGDPSDNRLVNLRPASPSENQQNRRSARTDNKSGLLGVSPAGRGWLASITLNRELKHLGRFKTPEAAHAAYLAAKRELHPRSEL